MKHILTVLVENEAGVLSRVAGLFSARGFNIESLCVAPVGDGTHSRITLVTAGHDAIIEQITKQLNKLIPVLRVVDLTEGEHVSRELMLVKVQAEGEARSEILRLVEIFRARVVDASLSTLTVEATGASDKLEAFLSLLTPQGVVEMVRTGAVALSRGARESSSSKK